MLKRIHKAISKVLFCNSIAKDRSACLRLLMNTKRYAFRKTAYQPGEQAVRYPLRRFFKEVYLRTAAGDISVFYEIFWLKMYALPSIDVRQFRVIVDAGANVGLSALYFHSLSPHANIYAIEPDAANFQVLLKNAEQSNGKIIPLQKALSNSDGKAGIVLSANAYNSHLVDDGQAASSVETISMNTLISRYDLDKIDLLKIDVEGYEHVIFRDQLQWLEKVDNIIIEIHSSLDHDVCTKAMISKGFHMTHLDPPAAGLENLYWARNERLSV